MPAAKGKTIAPDPEKNVIIPKSKKDKDGPQLISIPTVIQRFALVKVKGTLPLVMDRLTPRTGWDIVRKHLAKAFPRLKDLFTHKPKVMPPRVLFYESMHQCANTDYQVHVEVTEPFVFPGNEKPDTFEMDIKPCFPTSGLKKGIIEAAKKMVTAELIGKSYPNLIRGCVHIQGTVMPITKFSELRMEQRIVKAHPKWLPVFYDWEGEVVFSWLEPMINMNSAIAIFANSGIMSGLGAGRPEKGGKNGTFLIEQQTLIDMIKAYTWISAHSDVFVEVPKEEEEEEEEKKQEG